MDKAKVLVYLSQETKILLKVQAAKTSDTISNLVEKAIKEYLGRNPVK